MSHACQCKACVSKRTPTKDSVTAAGFFSGEELSPNQYETPEGFLICESVPIARIGTQEYADIELPDIKPGPDGIIVVERDPEVVFSPDTFASLIGKPVTLGHPEGEVNPDNWSVLAKGSTHNPRRGEGDQSDLLIADLMITDKFAINEVRNNGLRGISVGYDANYEQIAPGRARQTTIVANHVALVRNPRCGATCSVQDSASLLGDSSMASKKKPSALFDRLRKAFMTKDSEGFEKTLEEMNDEAPESGNVPAIHIHMAGAEKPAEPTGDADPEPDPDPAPAADPMAQVMDAIKAVADSVAAIGERVSKLEAGPTADADPEPSGDPDPEPEPTGDADPEPEPEGKDKPAATNDSASFRDEFQDAKARAEILAPGVKLPTFDAKAASKTTSDSLCVLRRRALRAALTNDNADLVRAITGDADVSKMTCDAAKMAFHASSELVKQKNKTVARKTTDAAKEAKDINQIHAEFWANRK